MTDKVRQPDTDVYLNAQTLRGLAHPLRVQALAWLRRNGPATATTLAASLGQTSGATSYHLRQLAAYGFVVELSDRGNGRDRWWQATHRATRFNLAADVIGSDEAILSAGAEYLRSVARMYTARMIEFTDGLEALADEAPMWVDAFTLSDWSMTLTAAQAHDLSRELERTCAEFCDRFDSDGAPDARPVRLQIQVFPVDPA